jgi:hypothetical protein
MDKIISKQTNQTFSMRGHALECEVFFNDEVAKQKYQRKYYPITAEDATIPKASMPITEEIINSLVDKTFESVETDNELINSVVTNEFMRQILVETLVGGNALVTISKGDESPLPKLQLWTAPFIYRSAEQTQSYGIEYVQQVEQEMKPVLTKELIITDKERYVDIPIDSQRIGNQIHNLNFTPATFFTSIDRDNDDVYGEGYPERFIDLVIKYNQIYSQALHALVCLQNVWLTTADAPNPEVPIRLRPNYVNFIGKDGKLEQVTRNLNLTEERTLLDLIKKQIYEVSCVPGFLTSIEDASKFPSGEALSYAMKPFENVTNRIRETFRMSLEDLFMKILRVVQPNYNTPVNINIKTPNLKLDIPNTLLLVTAGIITQDEARLLILPKLGLDVK